MEWRNHRSAGVRAASVAGEWPGVEAPTARAAALSGGTLVGSWSHDHAVGVWNDSRRALALSAGKLGTTQLEEMAALAYVGLLGSHLAGCARCWRVGIYEDPRAASPARWLSWAVARRPALALVFEPVWLEVSGARLDRRAPAVSAARTP